jgi:hypothetical protein
MKIKAFLLIGVCFFLSSCTLLFEKEPLDPEDQAYLDNVQSFPYINKYDTTLAFRIPKEEAEDAWGRIQVFIEKWSDMKVSRITNYVIETYMPPKTGEGRYGYKAIRTPMGNEVRFDVTCESGYRYASGGANTNAHILAYYSKTGDLRAKFISYYGKR